MDKHTDRRAALHGKRIALAVSAAFIPFGKAYALPTGEQVISGDVSVARPTAQTMQIDQASQKGIVNWQGFSIGSTEHVNITQPSSTASLLNRVVGNDPSQIFGRLTANGQVFLVNNAGVYFAPGASVEVGSLLASTLSITDQNFLNGIYQFYNPGSAGTVVNAGSIVTAGGFTALVGPQVSNSGVIIANAGKVALGAGDRITLSMFDDNLVSISVDEAAFNASVVNTGTLQADGGAVLLKASSVNALLDTVINTSGVVRAAQLVERNGEIVLEGTGNVQIAGSVESSGPTTVNVDGAVRVVGSGPQDAQLTSFGGQTINARSMEVTSLDGRFVSVRNTGPSAQTISLANGAGLDVQTLSGGGFAQVSAEAGGSQTINVVNGDHVNINGAGGGAMVAAFGGPQTISITGNGANAITLGAAGSLGPSSIFGGIQNITAGASGESGSITIVGGNANATFTGISSGQIVGGTQAVSTSGTLRIAGGDAPNQPPSGFATGLFHNGSGEQTVNAANLEMQGGSSGANNLAIIISSGGALTITPGDQVINVAGNVGLAGGSGGTNNTAIIVSFADQTVNAGAVDLKGGTGGVNNGAFINIANPGGNQFFNIAGDISIAGGAGGIAGFTGSPTFQQTIFANDISLTNAAAGGNNSVGFILGGHQDIHATGDVTLTARASGGDLPGVRIGGLAGASPTATDLDMFIGGDLVLTGGTAANNGVGIGSTGAVGPALDNTIDISAGGNVILNSGTLPGTGARIGSSINTGATHGNISIAAGGGIELNGTAQGTAIRTLDNVTLSAASINEASNGRIIANALATNTAGNTNLAGSNQVESFSGVSGADLTLNNTGALNVGNLSAANATLTNAGNVTLSGPWFTFGTTSISLASDLAVNSFVQSNGPMTVDVDGAVRVVGSGAQDASLTSFGGQVINARSMEITSLDGRFASVGNNASGNQTIAVSGGGMDIDSVSGNGFAFITNSGTGAQAISTSGGQGIHVRTSSGSGSGQINNFGAGDQTISVSGGGGVDVRTLSGTGFSLISNAGNGNQTIAVNGGTGVDVVSGGGFATINQSAPGMAQTLAVVNADHINVNGVGGSANIAANGGTQTLSITGSGANAITLGSPGSLGFSQVANASIQNVTAGLAGEQGSITIVGPAANSAAASIGSRPGPGGTQTITTSGLLSITGGTAPNQTFSSGVFHNGSGEQTITAADISLTGGPSGSGNRVQIGSFGGGVPANAGNQVINVAGGEISVRGSDAGSINGANIVSFANQTINGDPNLVLIGGASAVAGVPNSSFATINTSVDGSQTIHAGTITMTNSPGANSDSFAGINATHQQITTTGDVTLAPQGGSARIGGQGGGATDLQLNVGGNLLVDAGVSANGANIGSSPIGTPFPNKITIAAAGDVILSSGASGAGARIGATATGSVGGDISVTASNIQLNGAVAPAAIRTLDNVTLQAGSISESGNAFILANTLGTTTTGNTSLTGPNQVSNLSASAGGDVTLNNSSGAPGGDFHVISVSASGTAALSNLGYLYLDGPVQAHDVFLHSALADILENPAGSVASSSLTASAYGSISLFRSNAISRFAGSATTGNLMLNNNGTLDVTGLSASEGARVDIYNTGGVTISGPWIGGATNTIGTFDSGASVVEAPSGFIQSTGHFGVDANGDISLNGPNQMSRFFGYARQGDVSVINTGDLSFSGTTQNGAINLVNNGALDFSGFAAGGNINVTNIGALTVTALSGFNAAVANVGPIIVSGSWSSSAATSLTTTGLGSDLNVNNFVNSSGPMTLSVDGAVRVMASGLQEAFLISSGGQSINARSLEVTSVDGRGATIGNVGTGDQTITVSNGAGIDVQTLSGGGFASISQNAPGFSQTIAATNADHINVNGLGGNASIFTSGGIQTVSTVGGGANAIRLGSPAALGFSQIVGSSSQNVTAGAAGESGLLSIEGGAAQNSGAGIFNLGGGAQTVNAAAVYLRGGASGSASGAFINTGYTSGSTQQFNVSNAITVEGGSGSNNGAGIFQVGSGTQTVNAAAIHLRGGSSGQNNGALIASTASGDQTFTVTGEIRLEGGADGTANRAGMVTNGGQTINGNPDLILMGGGGGADGLGNNVFINATGGDAKPQVLNVRNMLLAAGPGVDASATMGATRQNITASGDVSLIGSDGLGSAQGTRIGGLFGPTPTPTNLTLAVGGDLLLRGGSGPSNGAGLGAAGTSTQPNTIMITALSGDVTLEAGTGSGARIGSPLLAPSAGPGDINITAGGQIHLNGTAQPTAIRTQGTVTLNAAGISEEASNGLIVAGTLNTASSGSTNLVGPNQIANFNATSTGGDVSLNNTGVLDVTGMNAFGNATIANIGNVTVSGPWTAGGTSTITVGSDILLQSAMHSHDVVLVSTTGGIFEDPGASITAETLTTSSVGDTFLDGTNAIGTISATSSAGNVSFNTSSPLLTLSSIDLPGALLVNHTGAVSVQGEVSALSHDIHATGDVTVGGAAGDGPTLLYAPGHIFISTPQSILVRGSDVAPLGTAAVLADGAVKLFAGDVSIIGGAAPSAAAAVRGASVDMSVANLNVTGGSGRQASALLSSGSNIDLTVGNALRIDAGSGQQSVARIQTELRDGAIHITFPNLDHGGYFVNGVEGQTQHGQTGFFTGTKPAKEGKTLLLEYGED